MMFGSVRLRMTAFATGGAVMMALAVPAGTAVATGEAPGRAVTAPTVATASAKPVLSSEYGVARSRVVGTYGRAGTVKGWFTPRRFDNRGGELVAIGRLHGILVRPDGTVKDEGNARIVIPVKSIEGVRTARQLATCDILNLVLGPLDLNLLGLEVHLNRVVLDIVARTGAGNLLGNLLCAVAGLLDGTGVLVPIRRILNSVLAILRL